MKHGIVLAALLGLLISACGSSSSSHFVGGTVTGLDGNLVLLLNSDTANAVHMTSSGTFQFTNGVSSGSQYVVTVANEPEGIACQVANNSGVMGDADVTNVTVTCAPEFGQFTVGGAVTGIGSDGLHPIQITDGNDTITVAHDGAFTFPTPLYGGKTYSVSVVSTSTGYSCGVENASGPVTITNVTDIVVTCQASTTSPVFFMSVTVSGLTTGTASIDNGELGDPNNPLIFRSGGAATQLFGHLFYNGEAFSLNLTPSSTEACTFDATGTHSLTGTVTSDINYAVTCTPATSYHVTVNVTGLTTGTATVGNGQSSDANNPLTFSSSAAATQSFLHPYPAGASYFLSLQNSNDESCTFSTSGPASHGTITGNITVAVTCVPAPTYTVEVQVTGLTTGNANVSNNIVSDSSNPLIFSASGTKTFSHAYLAGESYDMTLTNSDDEVCTFTGGGGTQRSGTISGNVSLAVSCQASPFSVHVSVQNLLQGNTITLTDNTNTFVLTPTENSNTFPQPYYVNGTYNVTLSVSGAQSCFFSTTTNTSASGTVGRANVELVIWCQPYYVTLSAPNLRDALVVATNNQSDPNLTLTPGDDRQTFAWGYMPGDAYTIGVASSGNQTCYFAGTGGSAEASGSFASTTGNVELELDCEAYVNVTALNVSGGNTITVMDNFNTITLTAAQPEMRLPQVYTNSSYAVNFSVTGSQTCYFAGNTNTTAAGHVAQDSVDLVIVCQPYTLSVAAPMLGDGSVEVTDNLGDPNLILTPVTPGQTFVSTFMPGDTYNVGFTANTNQTCYFAGTTSTQTSGQFSTTTDDVELQIDCEAYLSVTAQNLQPGNRVIVTDNFNTITLTPGQPRMQLPRIYTNGSFELSLGVNGSQSCYFAGAGGNLTTTGRVGQDNLNVNVLCGPFTLTVSAPNLLNGTLEVTDNQVGDPNLLLTSGNTSQTFGVVFNNGDPYTVGFTSTSTQTCTFDSTGTAQASGQISGGIGNLDLNITCQ